MNAYRGAGNEVSPIALDGAIHARPATIRTSKRAVRHRVRTMRVGWSALGMIAVGWLWAGWRLRDGGFSGVLEAAVFFGAFWLVVALLLIAVWDMFVAIDRRPEIPSLRFGSQRFPMSLRQWVVPVAFLVGLAVGHNWQ